MTNDNIITDIYYISGYINISVSIYIICQVASQLAGVEAQFQTALDRLIETNSGAAVQPSSNTDVTNEMEHTEDVATHDPDNLHYYEDTKACQRSPTMFGSHDHASEKTSHSNTLKEMRREIIYADREDTQEG